MRRHAGRPDTKMSEELDRLILQTASQLFAEQGYAATSMEQIAASAQVGKQTIYRRHASKEALFMTVMTDLGQSFLSAAAPAAATVSADPLLALRQTMRRLLDLVLSPPTIALSRTFVAEGWRFPDLVEHAGVHIFDPLERLTHDLLVAVEAAGLLNGAYDLVETSRALSALLLGGPHQHVLFGRNAFATKAARDHYLDQSWAMFMTGILSRTAATRQDVHA
ncbi:TetR/AcrR family transcriptional regulator [Acetobacter lambici]|uniref:TetR/AcrR family transcriptional regulator n=2 Tax=Acetobacter lambici TaxID=1332824 RepID=A0ABT1F5T8_9PROT|nr:TetR/AcrR family transcriptional regulator [Acetobacter lambici]MCP1242942.1 TetR/AcrR family transcriptional regulator [Acetobacter lambici]MCP1259109.1 TetR/AcrR family transcriptional regulator [Acetobacter lambici]